MLRRPALLLLALLYGCMGPGVVRMPERLTAVPGTNGPLDQRVVSVRRQFDRGEPVEALIAIDEFLASHPDHVDAHRVRQQILQERGRRGLLAYEAEQRLRDHPESPKAHYLFGRIQDDDQKKLASFDAAVRRDPSYFWGWFGLAFVSRNSNPALANRIYERLYQASRRHSVVALAYAASLRQVGKNQKAMQIYTRMQKQAPGVSAIGIAQTYLARRGRDRAWPYALRAMKHRPFDPAVRDFVRRFFSHGLPDDRVQELMDVLRQDPERIAAFAKDGRGLLAALYHRVGEPYAALELLQNRAHLTPEARHLQLKLLMSVGDVAGYLRELNAHFPDDFLADETNQVRGVWVSLLRGPWMRGTDPLALPEPAVALVRAMRSAGLLQDAEQLASLAILRHGSGAGTLQQLQGLREELRKEIAFESGLRRMVTRGYAFFAKSGRRSQDLKYFLNEVRVLSRRTFGKDVVGDPEIFSVPFVGRLVNPFGDGLGRHLARYNKHLVLGQRNGRPVEAMMMSRLSLRVVDPVPDMPLPANCREVVADRREFGPMLQNDLAGIALLNHYVIDMDQVRTWALTLQQQRGIARLDGKLLGDPLPKKWSGAEPLDVEWRLNLMSPVQDSDLPMAVLDLIRWHELGHMVDFRYFLPPTLHPWRSLALLIRNGLSAARVGGEMEARAEVAALAKSPHTRLVLAHIAGFLVGDPGASPHADGFRRLAERIQAAQRRQGKPGHIYRWHEMDPELARRVGQKLLKELW